MGFLTLIKKSIYSPEFYRDLRSKPLSFSIKYFYMLALALSLVITAVFSFTLVPTLNSLLKNIGPAVDAYFPDELVVTIRGGEVSVNVPEPYFLPIPAVLENIPVSDAGSAGRLPKNLVVIDTKNEFSEAAFAEYDTLVLIMKKSVAFSDREGIRIEPLRDIPDYTIDKALLQKFASKTGSFLKYAAPILVFVIFIIAMAIFTFHLVYLFLAALLVWLVMKARGASAGYKKAYQVGVHAMTLGFLLNALLVVVFLPRPNVPFLFTVVLLAVAAVNVRREEPSAEVLSSPAPTVPPGQAGPDGTIGAHGPA